MNFDYNEEQQLLADSIRRFIAKDYDFEARKKIVASKDGSSAKVWSTFAEMGLLGIPFGADLGGFGGGAIDLMSAMEAIGEGLVVEPFLPTVGLGAQFVARGGSEAQKKAILPALIEGKLKLAFAQTERGARYDLAQVAASARKTGKVWVLDGEKHVVLGAPLADKLVVSARSSGKPADAKGISLFLVDRAAAGV
ncbi:MAG: acyl-CoA dehydrogenase family protein, partial [Burkholderiales bacterium]